MALAAPLQIEIMDMDQIIADPNLEALCRKLSLGGSSGMNMALNNFQAIKRAEGRSLNAKGIFAKETVTQDYIGWALWTRETDNYYFMPQPGDSCFQVYVTPRFRRMGVGTQLFQAARSIANPEEQIKVYLWSEPNFFNNFKNKGLCQEIR